MSQSLYVTNANAGSVASQFDVHSIPVQLVIYRGLLTLLQETFFAVMCFCMKSPLRVLPFLVMHVARIRRNARAGLPAPCVRDGVSTVRSGAGVGLKDH